MTGLLLFTLLAIATLVIASPGMLDLIASDGVDVTNGTDKTVEAYPKDGVRRPGIIYFEVETASKLRIKQFRIAGEDVLHNKNDSFLPLAESIYNLDNGEGLDLAVAVGADNFEHMIPQCDYRNGVSVTFTNASGADVEVRLVVHWRP